MYNVYDKVSHPVHGLCEITEITEQVNSYSDCMVQYYKLIPSSQTPATAIFVPVAKADEIGVRTLITKEQARKLMDSIPDMDEEWISNAAAKQKKYQSLFNGNTIDDLKESLSFFSMIIRQNKDNHLGINDKSMFTHLKNKIIFELAFVLNTSADEILQQTQDMSLHKNQEEMV